jgi:DNA-directed RNA polymerase subunit alpha
MYIKAKGPGEIRAGNFETDSETDIIDQDQIIMTLDSNADIELEANVDTGKGYVSAEVAEDENKLIGEIKIDAMFSPVKKTSYRIENSRVGQVTDYDKLILEVETNGAISPDDAVALAARILQDQLQSFINFDEPEIQKEPSSKEQLPFNHNLLKKVEELELSVRSANCLKNDNIVYIGDLVQKSESDMLRTPNFGRKSLNEIKEVLQQMDLGLGVSVSDWPPENIDELAKQFEDPFNKY